MYAVIETGGKQYKVSEGDTLPVEKLGVAANSKYSFDKVLLVSADTLKIGQPYVAGASVSATVVEGEKKDEKVIIQKFRPKTGYMRRKGHRQIYSIVKIDKINS